MVVPPLRTIETRNGCAESFPSFSSAAVVEGDAVVRRRSSETVAQVSVIACMRLGQKFVRRENSPFRFAPSCEISPSYLHTPTGRMFRVLQNLNSDTNRPVAKNKRKSSAERRRRRLATAAAIEEHAQAQRDAHEAQEEECYYYDENDEEFSTKTMIQTTWGDPWDDTMDYEDENREILGLIACSTEEQITEASRAVRTWGTFIDESSKYDVWRPTLEFLLSR